MYTFSLVMGQIMLHNVYPFILLNYDEKKTQSDRP